MRPRLQVLLALAVPAVAASNIQTLTLPAPMGGANLTGVAYRLAAINNSGTGDIDVYTAPAGKRGLGTSIWCFNGTGGGIAVIPKLKSGGVYYRFTQSTTVNAGVTNVLGGNHGMMIAEPGESLALNIAAVGLNCWWRVTEFDAATTGFKTVKLTALAAGNNALYTVPAGKTALVYSINLSVSGTGAGSNTGIFYTNNSGAGRTLTIHCVASGGAPGAANQSTAATVVGDAGQLGGSPCPSMGAGDFLNVNTDAATATQFAWATVLEIP